MMTITLIIAFVLLLGGRLFLEWLSNKFEIFASWFLVANIALIVISVFLVMSLVTQIVKQIVEVRNAFPPKSETSRAAGVRERGRENASVHESRREQKERKKKARKTEREKIRLIEAYEKRRTGK